MMRLPWPWQRGRTDTPRRQNAYSVGFRDKALCAAFNAGLRQSGAYDQIIAHYGFQWIGL
jgi:hypothetical protein